MRSPSISVLLDRAVVETARARAFAFRETGFTPLDYDLLSAVSRRRFFSLAELARVLGVDRTTILRRVRIHFGQGWISTCGSRRRRTRVRITSIGRSVLATLSEVARRAEEDCTRILLDHALFVRMRRARRERTRKERSENAEPQADASSGSVQ